MKPTKLKPQKWRTIHTKNKVRDLCDYITAQQDRGLDRAISRIFLDKYTRKMFKPTKANRKFWAHFETIPIEERRHEF